MYSYITLSGYRTFFSFKQFFLYKTAENKIFNLKTFYSSIYNIDNHTFIPNELF